MEFNIKHPQPVLTTFRELGCGSCFLIRRTGTVYMKTLSGAMPYVLDLSDGFIITMHETEIVIPIKNPTITGER